MWVPCIHTLDARLALAAKNRESPRAKGTKTTKGPGHFAGEYK